jgi:hypothetical protein
MIWRPGAVGLPWPLVERWIVWLIAAHSVAIGVMLLAAPAWSVRFAGWEGAEPLFFLRQAGVFHLVVATGYVLEYRRNGTVTLLAVTKFMACVFLLASALLTDTAWSVLFSGIVDGAMGGAAVLVHRWAARDPSFLKVT